MLGMENEHVLSGLIRKRAEIARQLEAAQMQARQLIINLDSLDATIRLFAPDIDLVRTVQPVAKPARARVSLAHIRSGITLCCNQCLTESDLQIEFVFLSPNAVAEVQHEGQPFAQQRLRLHHRRARHRLLTGLQPVFDCALGQSCLGAMMRGEGPHVPTATLWKYFACYPYLPRLRDSDVLAKAIDKGLDLAGSTFGYASEVTEDGQYLDLTRTRGPVQITARSVLLRPEVAREIDLKQAGPVLQPVGRDGRDLGETPAGPLDPNPQSPSPRPPTPGPPRQTRYFGSVEISPDRAVRDFSTIANELLAHLVGQRGAKVMLRLEIDGQLPSGFSPEIVRVVLENGSALKFASNAFAEE